MGTVPSDSTSSSHGQGLFLSFRGPPASEREECTMLNLATRDGGRREKTDTDATLPLAQ